MVDPAAIVGGQPQFRQTNPSTSPSQPMPPYPQHPQQANVMTTPINRTHSFPFRYMSEMENKVYEGSFTIKKMSVRDLAQIGVRKVQLNGGLHFDENNPGHGIERHINNMNGMMAHLEFAVIQAPTWFNLDEIIDPDLLQVLYEEVLKFENSFLPARLREELSTGRSSADDRSQTGQEPGHAGHPPQLVGGQVPPSIDP